jgi:hypothetical protein
MRHHTHIQQTLVAFSALVLLSAGTAFADVKLDQSPMERELARIQFESATQSVSQLLADDFSDGEGAGFTDNPSQVPGKKSPFKAFALSAAVPGLGQLYNGHELRAAGFFGLDVTAWILHFTWHADASNMEDEFEAFNREHWSEADYDAYLMSAYPEYIDSATMTIDDNWIPEPEISHHLPDTRTQQYYEMTGKYDQFVWGWDDAVYQDMTLSEWLGSGQQMVRITDNGIAPFSARRFVYEEMRNDANNKFDDANRMIIVSIVNRLISGFEALLSAKSHNSNLTRASVSPPRLKVRAQLKSVYEWNDTPYLNIAWRF